MDSLELAVKTTLLPLQINVGPPAVIDTVGLGNTAIVMDAVAIPHVEDTTVAVYTPGLLTEVVAVVAPLLQE